MTICLICLKSFNSDSSLQTEKCSLPLLTKFFKFVENFLHISTSATKQIFNTDESGRDVFCEKCELAIVNPICHLYLQLLSTQLRLSWELDQLSKLLETSRTNFPENLELLNNSLISQLRVSDVTDFRQHLITSCRLEGRKYLPLAILTRNENSTSSNQLINDDDGKVEVESDLFNQEIDQDCESDWCPSTSSYDTQQQPENCDLEKCNDTLTIFEDDMKKEVLENDLININNAPNKTSESTSTQKFDQHKRTEVLESEPQPTKWSCVDCEIEFTTKGRLEGHRSRCHRETSCQFCEESFPGLIALRNHIKKFHSQEKTNIKGEKIPCPTCKKLFSTRQSLLQHKNISHGDKRHTCPVCSKTFKCKYKMRQHHSALHDPKPNICAQCGKTYASLKYLNEHMARSHPEVGPEAKVICSYCPKRFRVKYLLEKHLVKVHPDARENLSCSTCGLKMESSRRIHMETHELTHKSVEERRLGGNLHMCHVCGKEFLSMDSYNRHLVTHQQIEHKKC